MFFFLVCTLVGLDTIGSVASHGAQGFTWLIFLVPVFFIPYALLTSELGSTFTEEGGPYIWTKLALGRFVSGVNALIYWISNPIWLGGTLCITAVATFEAFFTGLGDWKYIFGLAFIWISVWAAILSFGVGKWLPTIGAWGRMVVLDVLHRDRRHLRDQARRARRLTAATSSRATACSSRSCRCSSSTTSASSCRTPPATR